ncbi:MAG: response regulator [Gemmatimonadaceae bacterium]
MDDNRDAADLLAVLLRMRGHEVDLSYDGVEGIAAAERLRPEIVLLDLGMPRLNGYDTCRHMREQAWGKELVIVAFTSKPHEDERRSIAAGFDLHMTKPVDRSELSVLLELLDPQRGPLRFPFGGTA